MFATIAILSFALAIALNTTMYSLLDALIDPRVDVPQPEQLRRMQLFGDAARRLRPGAIDDALRGVPGIVGATGSRFVTTGGEATVEHGPLAVDVTIREVRANFFTVLAVRPSEGRVFSEADRRAAAPLAVVSDRLVARLFPDGRLPVGATVYVEGRPYTVVGVVPLSPIISELSVDAWLFNPETERAVYLGLIRLSGGADSAVAASALPVVAARLAIASGGKASEATFRLRGTVVRQFRVGRFHWALAAAALAVLLVACGNLANLQLARGLSRSSELAIRSALGATRRDLVSLMLNEVLLLAAAGLCLGLVLAFWGIRLLHAAIPPAMADFLIAPSVHWPMLGVAVGATLVCLAIVGLWPAWRMAGVDPNALLKSRAGTGAHRHHRRRYAGLIVIQLSLALPLLCGMMLIARSAWRLDRASYLIEQIVGYDPRPLVTANVTLDAPPGARLQLASVAADLVARVRALGDVADATVITSAPPLHHTVTVQDQEGYEREIPAPMWEERLVSPSYFKTLRRPITAGSGFNEGAYGFSEVVMDEPTARYLWRGGNPIGRLMKFGDRRSATPWARVVGVMHDQMDTTTLRLRDPAFGNHLAALYRPFTVNDTMVVGPRGLQLTLMARVHGDPHRAAVQIRHALWTMASVASSHVMPLDDRLGITTARTRERFVAFIFTIFAAIGTALALLGVYSIVAHSVTERRREFGVRISLGATSARILRDVLREGNLVALLGIAGGLLFTKWTAFWVIPFVNGKDDVFDAAFFALIAISLALTTVLAALIPAVHATRIDPTEALRSD